MAICLSCARRRLAGKPEEACSACLRLNVDPLAIVRANHAKPHPLDRFTFDGPSFMSQSHGQPQKPARRASRRGGSE